MTFRVEVAGSGEQAIAAVGGGSQRGPVRDRVPRLANAGLDGIETARRIARCRLAAPPRRILVTAYGREEVFREAEPPAFDGVLIKPVSPSLLFDAALEALGRSAANRGRAIGAAARSDSRSSASASAVRGCCSWRTTRSTSRSPPNCSEDVGMLVDVAENGQVGLGPRAARLYDLVLMDMQMPVMDGLKRRADPRMPGLRGCRSSP